jgi:hypothetical protein
MQSELIKRHHLQRFQARQGIQGMEMPRGTVKEHEKEDLGRCG